MRLGFDISWILSTTLMLGCRLPSLTDTPHSDRLLEAHHSQASLSTWLGSITGSSDSEDVLLLTGETASNSTNALDDVPSEPVDDTEGTSLEEAEAEASDHATINATELPHTDDYAVEAAKPLTPTLPALMDETTLQREAHRSEIALRQILKRADLSAWEHPEFERAMYNPDGLPLADIVRRRHEILQALPQYSPVDGWISSTVGWRSVPGEAAQQMHKGVDIAASVGTIVYAPGDGVVRFAGPNSTYGNYIAIVHGYGVVTKYAHNAKLLVKAGDRIKTGDPIARVGESGRVRGAHLHYEIWVNDRYVNPMNFMPPTPALKDDQTRLAADLGTP